MKVLLVEDERSARLATAKLAESLGHEVEAVESAEDAMNVLARGGIDLLFTDLVLPKRNGLELVQWVRSREKESHLYALLLTSRDSAAQMDAAFAAGIDDFVTKGSSRTEIAARFRVAERITRVERHLRSRAIELDSALRRLDISAAMRTAPTSTRGTAKATVAPPQQAKVEILSSLRAWKGIESTLRQALTENAKHEVKVVPSPKTLDETSLASRIVLTDIDHKVEIEIAFIAQTSVVHTIACAIFGDPDMVDEAIVADTMLELSNGTMGVLKTSFHAEDYKFTPGIPKPITVASARQSLARASDQRALTFADGDVAITVLLGVRRKENRKLKVGALKEGMILATHVMRSGTMLLKAGTRLSEAFIEKLHRIDKELLVELSDPEDATTVTAAAAAE